MRRLLVTLLFSLTLGTASAGGLFGGLGDLGKVLSGGSGAADDSPTIDIGRIVRSASDAFGDVSDEEEALIGDEAVAVLLGAVPLLNNDPLQRYVNRVGRWVAMQTERKALAWRFGVLDSPDVNAFAAPGGSIFITRGLLERMASEAELAGALAHETAHVLKQHHLKAVRKGARIDLALALSETQMKGNDRDNLNRLAGGLKEVYTRGLDKEDEFEADRMGVVIATRAGYDPYGLPAVLQTLGAMNPGDSSLALLFKTHPSPDQRLTMLNPLFDILDPFADQPQVAKRFGKQLAALKRAP